MAGIENTLETIEDLEHVVVHGVEAFKAGVTSPVTALTALTKMITDGIDLAAEAELVLPELCDLDQEEAGKVGEASYVLVKNVLAAFKAAKK